MSYILAALKKADQEHFLGSVPDLATPQETQPPESRSFRWYWIIVALLVINTVLVVLLLKDRGKEVATAPVAGQAAVAAPASVSAAAPTSLDQQTLPSNDQAPQLVPPATDTQVDNAPVLEKVSTPAVEAPPSAGGEVVILPETNQTRNTELTLLPDENLDLPAEGAIATQEPTQVQSWFDLPQSVRNNLDLPRLDVHVYSEAPGGGFIMVNLKKYREGDSLPNGMVLKEVLPDGMIMSYQGERFRVDK